MKAASLHFPNPVRLAFGVRQDLIYDPNLIVPLNSSSGVCRIRGRIRFLAAHLATVCRRQHNRN
jgi:hypothetical protein